MHFEHMPQYQTCTSACLPLYRNPRIHRKGPCCTNRRGTCPQACTSEGSIAEHCKLTFRACHPSATVDPGSCPSRTAAAARARPISLQHSQKSQRRIWRGDGKRCSGRKQHSLTAAHRSRRPDHSPMLPRSGELIPAPTSRRSGAGRQEFDSQACTICQCDYYCFFSLEPSGKPAGPNSHTRRTASFHPRSGPAP